MTNVWLWWKKSKAIAFSACKSRLNFRVRDQFEIKILKVRLMNTTFKNIELEPAIIQKAGTCQRVTSKNTRTHSNWAREVFIWFVRGCLIFTAVNLIILIRMAYITDSVKLVSSCARSIVTFDIGLHEVCVRVGGRQNVLGRSLSWGAWPLSLE